jgi:hypothetical protein
MSAHIRFPLLMIRFCCRDSPWKLNPTRASEILARQAPSLSHFLRRSYSQQLSAILLKRSEEKIAT